MHPNQLVIVTANVGPGANQRVDIEIVDSSSQKNVYLSKRGINSETRLAVTAHAEGDVGVCFRNYLDRSTCFGNSLNDTSGLNCHESLQVFHMKNHRLALALLTLTWILVQMLWTISTHCFRHAFSSIILKCSYHSAIANQESLSGLETEMRKLEGIVKEIVEEMDYLKQREERFSSTNGASEKNICLMDWH